VFAYKTAVAVKALGYRNIKIYNGGIKDWEKSGHSLESIQRLPDYKYSFIGVEELFQRLSAPSACKDADGKPALTILDLRTEYHLATDELEAGQPLVLLATDCPVIYCLLDELQRPEVRELIPRQGTVVVITETGNRDQFVMQYLSAYGFSNIRGLEFGMRSWIKAGYPTQTLDPAQRPMSAGSVTTTSP
jgi:rhodanese-related sulfurtransferase